MSLWASINQVSAAWAALAWTVIWQSTLLALVVEALCLFLRRATPNLRLWLWQIVAIKLLVAPWWTPMIPMPRLSQRLVGSTATEEMPRSFEQAAVAGPLLATPAEVDVDVSPAGSITPAEATISAGRLNVFSWLLLLWACVLLILVGRVFVQRMRLLRLLGRARPLDDECVGEVINECSTALGLRRAPAVLISAEVRSPFVCGLIRNTLALPPGLAASLDPQQFRQAILHELAHLRRRDLVWSWLPELARMAYWLHPVAHWVRYRAHLERELACDQLALVHSGRNPAAYADMLVRVVSHGSKPTSIPL